ncbi:uncharacterized protein LOC106174250 isoform X2 [Lingula anatina]|uniref:Uncharacterized protein LOC106174250 isoform X2 n=1 Tax=Lingula anatina TaxID=7574 RepID=A0A1S3JM18_LINAN|nr:uncharacterized protein LOC106174250 isoform X2 [Lingula anatina]|eukprot:XP_013411166.1 uncharacterized protein LOC106174250 isoform X2 [Lingula anatina]
MVYPFTIISSIFDPAEEVLFLSNSRKAWDNSQVPDILEMIDDESKSVQMVEQHIKKETEIEVTDDNVTDVILDLSVSLCSNENQEIMFERFKPIKRSQGKHCKVLTASDERAINKHNERKRRERFKQNHNPQPRRQCLMQRVPRAVACQNLLPLGATCPSMKLQGREMKLKKPVVLLQRLSM